MEILIDVLLVLFVGLSGTVLFFYVGDSLITILKYTCPHKPKGYYLCLDCESCEFKLKAEFQSQSKAE